MAAGFVLDGELYRFTVHGQANGQDVITVLDYSIQDVTDVVTQLEFLTALRDAFRTAYLPSVVNDYSVTTYELQMYFDYSGGPTGPWTVTFADQILLAGTATDVGASAAAPLPTYVSATVRKLTGGGPATFYWPVGNPVIVGAERAFRGRISVGPLPESATQDALPNYLDETFRDDLNVSMDDLENIGLVAPGGTLDAFLVTTSLVKGGNARQDVTGIEYIGLQAVTNLFPNTYVGSQLSRKFTGPA